MGTVVVGIVIGLITGFAVMEAYAWFDAIAVWLMNRATRHIVKDQRDRYREEWAADLSAIPTSLYKLAYAATNFRKRVAYQINAVFIAGALDLFEEFAIESAHDYIRLNEKMDKLRARFSRDTWPNELQKDFVALERNHDALGVHFGKIQELRCRLEERASQVNNVASADAWFDEADRALDEIIARFENVGLP